MMPPTLRCPGCGRLAADAPPACPGCGLELSGYARAFFRPWLSYNRAVRLWSDGRHAAAARAAYAAVVLEPSAWTFRLLLARMLAATGELDEAIEHARAALDAEQARAEAEALLESLFTRKFARTTGENRCGAG